MAVNDSQGRAAGMNLPDASGFLMPEGQQGFGQIEQCLLVTGDAGLVRGNLQSPRHDLLGITEMIWDFQGKFDGIAVIEVKSVRFLAAGKFQGQGLAGMACPAEKGIIMNVKTAQGIVAGEIEHLLCQRFQGRAVGIEGQFLRASFNVDGPGAT